MRPKKFTMSSTKKLKIQKFKMELTKLYLQGSISTGPNSAPKLNIPHNHAPDHNSIAVAKEKYGEFSDAFHPIKISGKMKRKKKRESI